MSGDQQRRETAGITTRLIVAFVRDQLGAEAVTELFDRAGETRPVEVVEDERTWSTYAQKIALFDAAAELTGDPRVGFRIGSYVLDAQLGRAQRLVIGALGSPQQVLRSIARANAKFSTSASMRTIETSARRGTVAYRLHAEHTPSPHDCAYNQGLLSQVTVLFGLPAVDIDHPACQIDGAEECVYVLRWPVLRRFAPGARRRARRTTEQALRDQVSELEQAVLDALGGEELDLVLERLASRAGTAVRAQHHLLALRLEDGTERIIADGLAPDLARAQGKALLAGGALEGTEYTTIVAPIATARRRYGVLAALLPADGGFLPSEQDHLDAYAGLAAAAIEASMALAAERGSAAATHALLQLSRALAVAESEVEIARAVAEVVPVVTGAGRATVLHWDVEAGVLRTLAAVGFGADTAARLEIEIPRGATPALTRMLEAPGPLDLVRGSLDPFLDQLLARFGSERVMVVPLRDGGELLGMLTAGLHPGVELELDALLGVADQAAVAIARRRLLTAAMHAATHDRLTGLPGRELLTDRLERALADHRRTGRRVAVCFLDLDGFKAVNDERGHLAGDRTLIAVADRLRATVRDSDTVARIAGDEFVVLLRELGRPEDVHRSAAALVAAVAAPMTIEGAGEVVLGASLGVAVVPEHGTTAQELLQAADKAMYRVKAEGGSSYDLAAAPASPDTASPGAGHP